MGKIKKKRRVEEIYNATLEIKEAEITPVLSGNYPMQGPVPVDEMDNQAKMASSQVDKDVGRSTRSQKSETRVESGTCNMCSAPCSSCFHDNQAIFGSKSGESSGETCRENVFNCSVNADPTAKSKKCEIGQFSASEASIVITMNSSPDSFSENAQSKFNLQNVELPSKLSSGVYTTENPDNIKLHKLEPDGIENNFKDLRDFEGHGDNISCISGADGVTTVSSADSRTVETKRLPMYAASTNSLVSIDYLKAVPSRPAQCLQKFDVEGSKICATRKCDDITTQEVGPPVSFPDDLHDSRLLENALPEDIDDASGSVSVQSINSNTPKGKSSEVYFRSQLSGEMPDCPIECLNPLVTEKVVSNTLCRKESTFCISGNTRNMKLGVCGVNPKPEMEHRVKLEADDGVITAGLANKALSSLEHIYEVEKVKELLVLPGVKETSMQSLPTEPLNSVEKYHVNDESDILEHDQVCDTCGDIGREDLLAVCCRCSDGAEHTYCMAKKLDKFPEGGWMCQECKMEERKNQENDNRDEVGGVAHHFSLRVKAKNSQLCGNSGGKNTYSETSKTNKDSSYVNMPGKRNADSVEVSSTAKKQALEPTIRSLKKYSLDRVGIPRRNSSFKNLDRGGSEPLRQLHSVAYSFANTKGTEAPTLGTRQPTPRGTLLKFNSFSTANAKPKLKLVDEVFQKQKSMENPDVPDRKEGSSRVMGKSVSSKSLDSDRLCYGESKAKMLSPQYSHAQDLVGFKHAKEQNFSKRKSSFKVDGSQDGQPRAQESTNLAEKYNLPNLPIDQIPNLMDLPNQAYVVTSSLLTNTAFPEYEYIWQGCFEVHKSGKLPDLYDGFQAHLSTFASPRVIQTMNNFPHKVLLNEVPRLSTWPVQFVETGVREDHIGLYFFARDYESYVKCYKNVVERMMKNDLALKGNIDGVEILIFPSNQLPVKSQCWNKMFFLWGVFRGKRVNCQQQGNGYPVKVFSPQDIPTAIMSLPENILSIVPIDKEVVSHVSSDVVSEALAESPHLLLAGASCGTNFLPAFQKVTCSNLTVEQPEYNLDCNMLPSIPKWPPQSWPEVRSTPVGKTVGNAESLFPVDPFAVKNVDIGDRSILWNVEEELHQERVPNLELALGAEVKPMKKSRQDQALSRAATDAEEDVPASLSLSLSFPFPDEDHHCTPSFENGAAPVRRGTC